MPYHIIPTNWETKIDILPLFLVIEGVAPFTKHLVCRIQGCVQLHPNMLQSPPP